MTFLVCVKFSIRIGGDAVNSGKLPDKRPFHTFNEPENRTLFQPWVRRKLTSSGRDRFDGTPGEDSAEQQEGKGPG